MTGPRVRAVLVVAAIGLVGQLAWHEDSSGAAESAVQQGWVKDAVVAPAPATVPAPVPVPALAPKDRTVPSVRPAARYLERSYRAPDRLVARRAGGTLRIPALRIAAPVDAVGLDRGAMALPNDPGRVGWLRTTAAAGDRIGASVLSGHVSDDHDRPGALARLSGVRRGDVIVWIGVRGERHRFVVIGVHRYLRTRGVPSRLFRVDGLHLLHLITCTDRHSTGGGGFHYTSNLVVTARAVPGPR